MSKERQFKAISDLPIGNYSKSFLQSNQSIKCLMKDEGFFFFKYASTLLEHLDIEHPVFKYIVDVSQEFRKVYGARSADELLFYIHLWCTEVSQLNEMGLPEDCVLQQMEQVLDEIIQYVDTISVTTDEVTSTLSTLSSGIHKSEWSKSGIQKSELSESFDNLEESELCFKETGLGRKDAIKSDVKKMDLMTEQINHKSSQKGHKSSQNRHKTSQKGHKTSQRSLTPLDIVEVGELLTAASDETNKISRSLNTKATNTSIKDYDQSSKSDDFDVDNDVSWFFGDSTVRIPKIDSDGYFDKTESFESSVGATKLLHSTEQSCKEANNAKTEIDFITDKLLSQKTNFMKAESQMKTNQTKSKYESNTTELIGKNTIAIKTDNDLTETGNCDDDDDDDDDDDGDGDDDDDEEEDDDDDADDDDDGIQTIHLQMKNSDSDKIQLENDDVSWFFDVPEISNDESDALAENKMSDHVHHDTQKNVTEKNMDGSELADTTDNINEDLEKLQSDINNDIEGIIKSKQLKRNSEIGRCRGDSCNNCDNPDNFSTTLVDDVGVGDEFEDCFEDPVNVQYNDALHETSSPLEDEFLIVELKVPTDAERVNLVKLYHNKETSIYGRNNLKSDDDSVNKTCLSQSHINNLELQQCFSDYNKIKDKVSENSEKLNKLTDTSPIQQIEKTKSSEAKLKLNVKNNETVEIRVETVDRQTCDTDVSSVETDVSSGNTDVSSGNTDVSSGNTDVSSGNTDVLSARSSSRASDTINQIQGINALLKSLKSDATKHHPAEMSNNSKLPVKLDDRCCGNGNSIESSSYSSQIKGIDSLLQSIKIQNMKGENKMTDQQQNGQTINMGSDSNSSRLEIISDTEQNFVIDLNTKQSEKDATINQGGAVSKTVNGILDLTGVGVKPQGSGLNKTKILLRSRHMQAEVDCDYENSEMTENETTAIAKKEVNHNGGKTDVHSVKDLSKVLSDSQVWVTANKSSLNKSKILLKSRHMQAEDTYNEDVRVSANATELNNCVENKTDVVNSHKDLKNDFVTHRSEGKTPLKYPNFGIYCHQPRLGFHSRHLHGSTSEPSIIGDKLPWQKNDSVKTRTMKDSRARIEQIVNRINYTGEQTINKAICGVIEKHSSGEKLRLDTNVISSHCMFGSYSPPYVVDGVVLLADVSNTLNLHKIKGQSYKALLVNGDIEMEFKHKGFKSTHATQVSSLDAYINDVTKSDQWLNQVVDVLKQLSVSVLLVKGKVSSDVGYVCDSLGIQILQIVPYKHLYQLSEAAQVDMLTYVVLATEMHVVDIAEMKPLKPDWCDMNTKERKNQEIVVVLPNNNPLTVVISECTSVQAELKDQELWDCLNKMAIMLDSGRLLPGFGQTEEKCITFIDTCTSNLKMDMVIPSNEALYRHHVLEMMSSTFRQFIRLVQCNQLPEDSECIDCYTSKIQTWKVAMATVNVLMRLDYHIVTGLTDNQGSL